MIRLSKKQLREKHAFVKRYMGEGNNATLSELNPNSNVHMKNVATLAGEIHTDVDVQVNRYILGEKIKEVFGKKVQKSYYKSLKKHEIYVNDESGLRPYCLAVSTVPFIYNGASNIVGDCKPPLHLASYCGSYINLLYAIAGQVVGAVADPSLLVYFHYFARKDYGADYLKTNKADIENFFQQIVYSGNSTAGSRNFQSPFWNMSLYDKYYFEALFGEAVYPDGTKADWEGYNELQKFFLNWFGEERHKAILTFPVITSNYLTENGKVKDTEFVDFLAEQMSKGVSFFHYHSDSVDSLSSCCFDGSQKVLVRRTKTGVVETTFKELWDNKYTSNDVNYHVFHNGHWVRGKLIQLSGKQMYKVVTSNKKELLITEDHLNPTMRGDVRTDKLNTDDYLMMNTKASQTYPEVDKGLTYADGFFIGMYLGDGSMATGGEFDVEYSVSLSLNEDKYISHQLKIESAVKQIDPSANVCLGKPYNNVYPVSIHSKKVVGFIREYVEGSYSYEKRLNLNFLLQSEEFRRGIVDGYYATDGGNSNRIYTTSSGLVDDMEALFTSLGIHTVIDVTDRTDEPVIIRDKAYNRNYPLYCIRWYSPSNKRNYPSIYKTKLNSTYFKVASIEKLDKVPDYVYCFEMENEEEPYFTLPNGVITHNCRLKNKIEANPFAYSIGGGGLLTGSVKVITLNINRLIQTKQDIAKKVKEVHQYLIAFRMLMQDFEDAHLMPLYDEGYIALDKQYITVGLNGIVEAAEFLGYEISPNEDYLGWVKNLFKTISDTNRAGAKFYTEMLGKKVLINTELIPAESVGVKLHNWDTRDGITSNRDCYNSYLYRVEDATLDFVDKFKMHGGDVLQYLDGGSAVHQNFEEIPNKGTWLKIIQKAIDTGSSYWTYNVKSTYCNKCGYIDMNTRNSCVKCNSTDVDYLTRVIGYLKKIKSFSAARQKEAGLRFYHKSVN